MHNPYQTPEANLGIAAAPRLQRLSEPRSVSAGRGIDWLSDGWRLFMRAPGMLLAISLTMLLLYFLVGLIPLLGTLVVSLFWPVLTAGFFLALKHADEGAPVTFGDLFAPLANLSGLLALGGLYLLAIVVITAVGVGLLAGLGVLSTFSGAAGQHMGEWMAAPGFMLVVVLFVALMALLGMAFIFAPILVHQQQLSATEALRQSFLASLRNVVPFLLWGLLLTFAGLVLGLLMLIPIVGALVMLAFCLLLMPLSAASLYCAYRDIFWR